MGFELPESMKKFGCRTITEEEYVERCKIDKNFCTGDEDEFESETELD